MEKFEAEKENIGNPYKFLSVTPNCRFEEIDFKFRRYAHGLIRQIVNLERSYLAVSDYNKPVELLELLRKSLVAYAVISCSGNTFKLCEMFGLQKPAVSFFLKWSLRIVKYKLICI